MFRFQGRRGSPNRLMAKRPSAKAAGSIAGDVAMSWTLPAYDCRHR